MLEELEKFIQSNRDQMFTPFSEKCSQCIILISKNCIIKYNNYFFDNCMGTIKITNIVVIEYIKNVIIVVPIFALTKYKITETIISITTNKAHKFPATLFAYSHFSLFSIIFLLWYPTLKSGNWECLFFNTKAKVPKINAKIIYSNNINSMYHFSLSQILIYIFDYKIFICHLQGIFISSFPMGTQFRKGRIFIIERNSEI